MADLLGSILGSMQKPPGLGDAERKKAREQQKQFEKLKEQEKEKLNKFRLQIQKKINGFIKDGQQQNMRLEPMEKVWRAIVHEVADVAGLTSFSFGQEEIDRYVMLWKKEFAPSDEELVAYRKGDEWDPEKAKELVRQKELDALSRESCISSKCETFVPHSNYKDKYEHLIGKVAAKDAAQATTANKSYGFVPSDNKRDSRTIEEVMAENKAKKKLKTEHGPEPSAMGENSKSESTAKPEETS
ncbi:Sperm-associated antigen 7 [Lamellibrachia satsuma]|nr:Sperm-associated antigen 7 [Lamellibrachia satsuma]